MTRRQDLALESLRAAAREAGAEGIVYSELLLVVRAAWADGAILGHGGNQSLAAADGGVHRNTLAKMRRTG